MLKSPPTLPYRVKGEQLDIGDIVSQTPGTRLEGAARPEVIVIMAGGMGLRMLPLTQETPKPMLKVQEAPMLEHILAQMVRQGFGNFVFSVRHLSGQLKSHFGDGSKWGVSIDYIDEIDPLGTAGGLSLLKSKPEHPFIVANADIITDLDYRRVLDNHRQTGAALTMCTREATFQIPYGVIWTQGQRVTEIVEKPTQSATISAGMYALSPEVLDHMKKGEAIDMPDLIQKLIALGEPVSALPISDKWVDAGRRDTYQALLHHLSQS